MQRRDELVRKVWAGMNQSERTEATNNASKDVTADELKTELKGDDKEKRAAKGKEFKAPFENQMKPGSRERVWTLGVWAVADFCGRLGATGAKQAGAAGGEKKQPPDAGTTADTPTPQQRSDAQRACAQLDPFFKELRTRTASFVTVEIVQPGVISEEAKKKREEEKAKKEAEAKKQEGAKTGTAESKAQDAKQPKPPERKKVTVNENTCNPDNPDILPLKNPPYSENQYESITSLYLRAANVAGQFPAITTHFAVDAFISGHCDPRCFDLDHLYGNIADAVNHERGSIYGIKPSYGRVSKTNNIWWDETGNDRCHGKPPGSK
ncbi:MAG: hypothetical protein ACREDR_25375 [Blastocatellia bacterium]